jgi:hypothetical protein
VASFAALIVSSYYAISIHCAPRLHITCKICVRPGAFVLVHSVALLSLERPSRRFLYRHTVIFYPQL